MIVGIRITKILINHSSSEDPVAFQGGGELTPRFIAAIVTDSINLKLSQSILK